MWLNVKLCLRYAKLTTAFDVHMRIEHVLCKRAQPIPRSRWPGNPVCVPVLIYLLVSLCSCSKSIDLHYDVDARELTLIWNQHLQDAPQGLIADQSNMNTLGKCHVSRECITVEGTAVRSVRVRHNCVYTTQVQPGPPIDNATPPGPRSPSVSYPHFVLLALPCTPRTSCRPALRQSNISPEMPLSLASAHPSWWCCLSSH